MMDVPWKFSQQCVVVRIKQRRREAVKATIFRSIQSSVLRPFYWNEASMLLEIQRGREKTDGALSGSYKSFTEIAAGM